jgi:carbamoyl-phosphate synthase large subunit
MPKRKDINKVLIIGSGPSIIGQTGEYDYFGSQACKALRSLDFKTVLINSNPATITTDLGTADVTYIEPINCGLLTKIIDAERPDALLPSVGGPAAFYVTSELFQTGILTKYDVEVIGISPKAMELKENRAAFKNTLKDLGMEIPESRTVKSIETAEKAAAELGYPVVIRSALTMGATGCGLAYNIEELRTWVGRGLSTSPTHRVLIEAAVLGWEELELVVLRDAKSQTINVCSIENVDAMGVHSGDSVCTVPMLTIDPELQQGLQKYAFDISQALEIVGPLNVKFAHDPKTDKVLVAEATPGISRPSALASKATGLPVARIASLLAGGLTLDEIPAGKNRTLETYTPCNEYVVVKFARWAFEKFEGVVNRLGPQMQAVGEVMGIGRTYKEAFQKAIRSLEINRTGSGLAADFNDKSLEELINLLSTPTSERQFLMFEALRKGADVRTLYKITHIKPWFIEQMKELVELETEIRNYKGQVLPEKVISQAKKDGFADKYLAFLTNVPEDDIRARRSTLDIFRGWQTVSASDGENGFYCFSSFNAPKAVKISKGQKIVILGAGPNRIGQGIEFDYCCVHAAAAIHGEGYESIVVNCNPAAVSTDHTASDALYFEPLEIESVLSICEREKPEGVIVQFGGQTPAKMAASLAQAGVRILGTAPKTMDLVEDRRRFRNQMCKLGIPQPLSDTAGTAEEAFEMARKIGYPLMIRYLGGSQHNTSQVVQDEDTLKHYLSAHVTVAGQKPVVIEQFLEYAVEAETDAIADGKNVFIPAVMEHIELAGVHSGDSACVIPPVSTAPRHVETICEYTRKIATELGVIGLMNVQYAVFRDTVYILNASLRATRTVPLVSKICNIPMARLASQILLGRKLSELGLKKRTIPYYGVREAVFPFNLLPEVDPLLGTEMRSSGEVLGLADSFGMAFFKSQEATQVSLPHEGTVLITVTDEDKSSIIEPVRLFRELGFSIRATRGTHRFLARHGIESRPIHKLGFGRPHLVDAIKSGQIQLVVNTPSGRQSQQDDSYIRKAAIKYGIPNITTPAGALAAARGIAARKKGPVRIRSLEDYYAELK